MVKVFKFSTMKLGKNTMLILITSLMNSTLRTEVKGLLLSWCICMCAIFLVIWLMYFSIWISVFKCLVWVLQIVFFFHLFYFMGIDAGQMLKKGVRQYFLQRGEISVPCHGGTSYLIVVNGVLQWNRKWVMHCYSGAWGLMQL